MSYTHVTVDKIAPYTGTVNTDHKWIIDGYPVSESLYKFCTELRFSTAFRQIKFGFTSSNRPIYNRLYAYYERDIYTLGQVGYGDFSVGGSGSKYMVRSPNITNKKFAYWRDAYTMVMTVNITKAVANAKQYLRPYNEIALCDASVSNFDSQISAHIWQRQQDLNRQLSGFAENIQDANDTYHGSEVMDILEAVVAGTQFTVSDTLKEKIAAYTTARREYQQNASKQFRPVLVISKFLGDGSVVFRLIRAGNTVAEAKSGARCDYHRAFRNAIHAGQFENATEETLPDNIRGKLAILSMMEDDKFYSNVGYRFNERICYVLEDV